MKRVIIFDWDDTLCPSSFVDKWKIERYNELPLHVRNILDEVGKASEKCLMEASKYGEVIIITNSDDGWVKFSAERFVPYLLPCLEHYRIISARTRYERFYPQQPLCWKAAAFAHEVNEIFNAESPTDDDDVAETSSSAGSMLLTDDSSSDTSNAPMNDESHSQPMKQTRSRREVISFGDSMEERTSVRIVANQLESHPKSVMFLNSPSPVQIIGQLEMLTEHMQFVCEHELDLDLEISPQQIHDTAENKGLPSDALIDQELTNWFHSIDD